ncbi:MAG: ParA family partition ATPase [Rhizobiaceae bacterium]
MTGQVITVAQQKGGSGKTTISLNLAVALLAGRSKVALLDTDPQGSLGQWFMARRERFGDTEPDMGFRTASAWGARYEARELAKTHDYVIIDTPPKMGVDGRPAIEAADLIIIPVTPSPLDVWATEPTLELATGEKKLAAFVMNRVPPRANISAEIRQILSETDGKCLRSELGNRVLYAETAAIGLGVTETRPKSVAAQEIRTLTKEIKNLLA